MRLDPAILPHLGLPSAAAAATKARTDLTVSLVVYELDKEALEQTLASLRCALESGIDAGIIESVSVDIVDNGSNAPALRSMVKRIFPRVQHPLATHVMSGHGNVGYGKGHNISILRARSAHHLVVNPDVILSPSAIIEAISYLRENESAVLLTPEVCGPSGEKQYLCRQYPSLFLLYLRAFAPNWLRRPFIEQLNAYELRESVATAAPVSVPLATGCFMFARTDALQRIGGFSPAFFLYFEDYDLSLRLRDLGEIVYVPSVRITHFGGNASKKGWRHVRMFARSAMIFFNSHGWRIW
jgi:GT2 family glycosyltransferase